MTNKEMEETSLIDESHQAHKRLTGVADPNGKPSKDEMQRQLIQSGKMAAFGQLGAGITHEAKNLIGGIVGFAQVGKKKADKPEKARELFALVERDALRCKEILTSFLKFTRAATRQMDNLDLNEVVDEARRIFSHNLAMHKVKLDLKPGEGLPKIKGNSGQLQQVLLNLIMNAQQAMPEGGSVEICTSTDGKGSAVITVSDDGPGISKEVQMRIFEPFFTTKKSSEGTGLGLAISHDIIRDHRGEIRVDSEVGKGARFTIQLPAADPLEETPKVDTDASDA
ncbi:sensor histidine kinase [Myxococcota bacterium]